MTTASRETTTLPIEGFRSFNTHHCVTGSLRHVYEFNHHPISEEMLLGLGEGVSFIYWHQKGQIPFFGGRGNPKPSMEEIAGERTGVEVIPHTTTSPRKARQTLIPMLSTGQPVMLQVDMGFLPYFNFGGTDYHFGGHVIVACGYDPDNDQVLVADRDGLFDVPMDDLVEARNSSYKPFPPKNRWYMFDFSNKCMPSPEMICTSIKNQALSMLIPPISNIGVKGIRKTAKQVVRWSKILDNEQMRFALFNGYIFISPVGGTGGGCFRYLFSRFLEEGAEMTGSQKLAKSAHDFKIIGDRWEALGGWFKEASEHSIPVSIIDECSAQLNKIADLEEEAWSALMEIISWENL